MGMLARFVAGCRQYLVVTGNYWAFTLTDGALRMLVVLHFLQPGLQPAAGLQRCFLFYEIFGRDYQSGRRLSGCSIGLNRP